MGSVRWRSPVDGLELFARVWNADSRTEPTVLLLHGLTHNSLVMAHFVAPRLAALGLRVFAPDTRGRGSSSHDPEARYLVECYERDTAALCDAHGVKNALFVGTSMGGLITLNVALSRPDLVRAVVLNDIGPEIDMSGIVRIASYAGNGLPELASLADAAAYFKRIYEFSTPNFTEWELLAGLLVDEQFRFRYDPAISHTVGKDPRILPEHLWRCLEAIKGPLVVLRGASSDILSADTLQKMVAKGGTAVEVPGIGHAPFLNEPASWEAIESLIRRLQAR